MTGLGRANEVIIAVTHISGQKPKGFRNFVREGLWTHPTFFRGLLHFLAVLIGPR